ncbi:SWI/SNF-related matrix-associated actin-dependent regulator of chromatin subfamily D member 3 isoform X2 [Phalacrocorax aristotelis]|uniref:SWI/SNF-related matrix-associated actin-dependent regulator of chromatin subfamily D member 3 isoform X2 n=1 Tax=Phalacrocorax aristotelis TaxID=126867 RepID=UPI003F4BAAB8
MSGNWRLCAGLDRLLQCAPGALRPGMPSGARMPHQGAPMGPPGPPYVGSPSVRPGMPQTVMETTRKRTAPQQVQQQQVQQQVQQQQQATQNRTRSAKRRKMADKILPQRIRELVPESQAYMDLLAFERKLDQTIMRKRVDIQEALKRPMKQKRKLRLYISNTFNPAKSDADDSDGSIASWELRVEGKLLDDLSKQKRKFSSFFKSLVIELDKDLYGPDNHLVEWHRTPTTQETDGFQVKRPGDVSVRCTLLLMLDYQPPQFKLDPRLARLLGIHTQTRSAIIQALWQYIKTNKLQDSHDKEYINCDKYFQQIFDCPRLKFSEIPQRLTNLLLPPDPIVINHIISVDPNDQKKTACYDIDVEVEDPLKGQMSSFLLSTANQQEITALDNKIHETIESINQLKIQRDFMLSFSKDPKGYIQDLLRSQSRDLKVMTDVVGNPEEERRAEFYHEPWSQEAVSRSSSAGRNWNNLWECATHKYRSQDLIGIMTTKPVDFSVLLSSLLHMDLLPDWMRMYYQHTSQNTSFRVTLENLARWGCLKPFQAKDSAVQVSVLKKIKGSFINMHH